MQRALLRVNVRTSDELKLKKYVLFAEKKEAVKQEKPKSTIEFVPNVIVKIECDQPTNRQMLKVIS